ncbi:class I SAM-dependent methyltransferase [Methyloligella sp. 2.7D]|uniref:class I SAM-dependent methyltransferase n=1 Tax=unclassified Methyloligella TaxID=2625955 RepID=UPI00157C86E1|nr:class I SAM-dependent methyltransferase [Methyloligella sp. GL2]QKP76410.1 class I SAM-dependent methyltransferase [Methyloligella sp. GL2]
MTMTSLVQKKFGDAAADYAASAVHATGPSLARLAELIEPQAHWRHLDIATGAGHTALLFAPRIAEATASDITQEMLRQAERLASERGLENVVTATAPADDLPFDDASYDLVTCRLAAHHFPAPAAFVAEAARVLKSGGVFALVDNISPAEKDRAARYNAFEKLRDPSHGRALSLQEWTELVDEAGLELESAEVMDQEIPFDPWVERMRCEPETIEELREMAYGEPLTQFLQPRETADGLIFSLREAILIARKP